MGPFTTTALVSVDSRRPPQPLFFHNLKLVTSWMHLSFGQGDKTVFIVTPYLSPGFSLVSEGV